MNRLFIFLLLGGGLLTGCAAVSELTSDAPKSVPPEYRQQKVGVYVHEKPERVYYPHSEATDVEDLMVYHLQQILPYSTENVLRQLFGKVEVAEEGPKIEFKAPDLAGYFEIKILSARYDFPDTDAARFLADVQLQVEFKTLNDDVIWSEIFRGEGRGFTNADERLTKFGRGASAALEAAFDDVVYEMQDGILASPPLREYFRSNLGSNVPAPPAAPAPAALSAKDKDS